MRQYFRLVIDVERFSALLVCFVDDDAFRSEDIVELKEDIHVTMNE